MSEVEELRALHDAQLRGRVPEVAPVGAVVEQDGPLIRAHYGTHGSVDYRDLPTDGLDELIVRQRDAFAGRGERGEWKVYAHDAPVELPDRLRAAGFTPGWERAVLVRSFDQVAADSPARLSEVSDEPERERIAWIAADAGPQRTSFAEFVIDRLLTWDSVMLVPAHGTPIDAAAWATNARGADFVVIEGIVDPKLRLVPHLTGWDWRCSGAHPWWRRPDARYFLAEADGALRDALERAGFQAITTATTYHWTPSAPPAETRPVRDLFRDAEYTALWERFTADFEFRPSTVTFPGITEPPGSVTWDLRDLAAAGIARLESVIERGLRACVPAGEPLYWLDWQHVGCRFDLERVGLPGQPEWPGAVHPDGDYYLYLTADLRLGTFGHPWESTLCVFGAELLAEVRSELTELLGPAIRGEAD